MHGAIKEDLGVIEAVAVNVTTNDSSCNAMSPRLLCYVSLTKEKAFISLGITHVNVTPVILINVWFGFLN